MLSVHYALCFSSIIYKNPAIECLQQTFLILGNNILYTFYAKCTVTCRPVSWIGHSPWKLPTLTPVAISHFIVCLVTTLALYNSLGDFSSVFSKKIVVFFTKNSSFFLSLLVHFFLAYFLNLWYTSLYNILYLKSKIYLTCFFKSTAKRV